MTTAYDFTVHFADGGGAVCQQPLSINVEPGPFDCLGNPENIQDVVWTPQNPPNPPCTLTTIVGGGGSWRIRSDTGGCLNNNFNSWSADVCNPGAAYLLTITAPWDGSGDINPFVPPPPYLIQLSLAFNNIVVDLDSHNVTAPGEPTPMVVSSMLPASAITNVKFNITFNMLPFAPSNYVDAFSTTDLSITPLTHP